MFSKLRKIDVTLIVKFITIISVTQQKQNFRLKQSKLIKPFHIYKLIPCSSTSDESMI